MHTRKPRDGGGVTALRKRERADFVATLRDLGPDGPTLCAGWSAFDIAAHIAVSEQAFGVPLFVFNGVRRVLPGRLTRLLVVRAQSSGERLNARARARGWDAVLGRLDAGPPRLYRLGSVAHLRMVEEWIHHEDVRRGAGLPARPMSPAFEAALWQAGRCVAQVPEFRVGRAGIELDAGAGRRLLIGDTAPRIRVSGPPGELLLYLVGRGDAAEVTLTGDSSAIRSVEPSLRV